MRSQATQVEKKVGAEPPARIATDKQTTVYFSDALHFDIDLSVIHPYTQQQATRTSRLLFSQQKYVDYHNDSEQIQLVALWPSCRRSRLRRRCSIHGRPAPDN